MPSQKFADKYLLAVEQASKEKPQGGLNGFEQEWNLLVLVSILLYTIHPCRLGG